VACKVASKLNLPTISIDKVIQEAIVSSKSLVAMKINEMINDQFLLVASEDDLEYPPYFGKNL